MEQRRIEAILELERRGKLNTQQVAALNELKRRGLVGGKPVEQLGTGYSTEPGYTPKPLEDYIPPVAATAGGILGGVSSIPTTFGVPLGAMAGAHIGGQAGETARQYVRALRGKPVPKTPLAALKETETVGAMYGALELAGQTIARGIIKGVEIPMTRRLSRKSFDNFKGYLEGIFKSGTKEQSVAVTKNPLYKEIKDKLASKITETGEFIDEFLEQRGISYKPSAEAIRSKLLQEADMSAPELAQAARQLADAKAAKLVSPLKTPSDVVEYRKLADILDDLSDKDLTYGQLHQIRETVGDIANFGSKDRTPAEKIYGTIYRKLNDDMGQTAAEGGFLEAHRKLNSEGKKYFQRKFLNNLFEDSLDYTPSGEIVNYSKLANKLNGYRNDQLKAIFDTNFKEIQALRDITNVYVRAAGGDKMFRAYATGRGVGAVASPRGGSAEGFRFPRFRLPGYVEKISQRRGVQIEAPVLKKTRKVLPPAVGLPIKFAPTGIEEQ